MSCEYFYAATLSATHTEETWDPEGKGEAYSRTNKLLIRQALLGPDAKPDEVNVIEVETISLDKAIKIPMAVLKVGENRQVRLDIEFPDAPVTFTLVQGSGPVHLIGQHLLGALVEDLEEMEMEMEDEEEMFDEEEDDDSQFKDDENKKKGATGKRKTNEDNEEGEPKGKKAKVSNNAKGKAPSPKKNAKK